MDVTRDWKHLGRCLRAARGGRTRAQVERETGVSSSQIKRYEAGLVTPEEMPPRMWDLAEYYRWTKESLDEVLAGGQPTYQAKDTSALPPLSSEVVDKVMDAVSTNQILTPAEKREFLRWLLAQAG